MMDSMIAFVESFQRTNQTMWASDLETKFPFRNRFTHSLRVRQWAKRINAVAKGDPEIVEIAAIFHDIGKGLDTTRPHAEVGADICDTYLHSIGFDEERLVKIVRAIRRHSSKKRSDLDLGIEEKVLMDADQLDEVGALCVLWDSLDSGAEPQPSYERVYSRILRQYGKQKNNAAIMKTAEGKRLYQERIDFLFHFLENLHYELGNEGELTIPEEEKPFWAG